MDIWLFTFIFICCPGWVPTTVIAAVDIECARCPDERKIKDKNGFLALEGCQQADVLAMQIKCRVCASTIGATDVVLEAKDKDDNVDTSVTLTEGWIHSRGCGSPKAKPGTCDYKNDQYICYCNEPRCNQMPPPCTWLQKANQSIPDPKGCINFADGDAVYTMEYTLHVETSETVKYTDQKEIHHRGMEKKNRPAIRGRGTGCGRFGSDKKACRTTAQCEFNVVTELCEDPPGSCQPTTDIKYCPRAGVFYNNAGVICKSSATEDDCPPLQVIVGTKVLLKEGQTMTDLRGVIYREEVIREDPFNTRTVDDQATSKCKLNMDHRNSENKLYLPSIYGNPNGVGTGGCLTYSVPELTDGDYELSVKFIEHVYENTATQRGFFINLETLHGSANLVYDLNVFNYVGHCKGMDLITNIKVSGGEIRLQGFEQLKYTYKEDRVSLSICYGEEAADPKYILSAFYIAKWTPDCHTHGNNKMACKQALCEFNLASGKCENRKRCKFDQSWNKHLRANSYYVNGGSVCFNENQENNGPSIDVLTGTKVLLKEGESILDARGVLYLPEKDYEDPHVTRTWDSEALKNCDLENILPASDRKVYYPAIYGRTGKRATKGCISYPLAELDSNGDYEISLKFLEFFYTKQSDIRGFSVRLQNSIGGELEILYDLNVFAYVGHCNPFEVLLLMNLDNGILKIQGFPDFNVGDKKLKLAFCYGDVAGKHNDPNYLLSAFYLAKLSRDCSSYGNDKQACRAAGCEVNTAKNTCENKRSCDTKPQLGDRLWANVYYLDGGTLCYNKDPKGYIVSEIITAQKLGLEDKSKTITDSRGVTYGPESTPDDPNNIRGVHKFSIADCGAASIINYEDEALYAPAVYGSNNRDKVSSNCMAYNIPNLSSDGEYELYLRTMETYWRNRHTGRLWNLRFNCGSKSHWLLYQHNIFAYAGACAPMDVVVLFKLVSGQLTVQGFPALPYKAGDKLQIAFCYGDVLPGVGDPNFVISAFHVAKYGAACPTIKGNNGRCRREGCEVNTANGLCENKRTTCDVSLNLGGSLRANVYFAVGGVLCYNEKQRGPRLNPRVIVATNLGHREPGAFPDSRGIVYLGDIDFEDSTGCRIDFIARCNQRLVHPAAERALYYYEMFGSNAKQAGRTGCVKYSIPHLKEDGTYEISMKMWEDYYDKNKPIRGFRVNLDVAGQTLQLLYDMNIFYYVGKCKQMEVVVPMQVAKGKLTVMGFPNAISLDGQPMKLAFCYGESADDPNFLLSAFHVARLTPNCATYGNDKRKCRNNNCEFHIAKAVCQNRMTCAENGRLGERLRADTFYIDGGVVCYNPEKQGELSHENLIYALKANLQDGTVTDSRGVIYGKEQLYDDPHNIRQFDGNYGQCGGRKFNPEINKNIFFPSINGNPKKQQTKGCITYNMKPIKEDGDYELSMKFIEYYWKTGEPQREFQVKLHCGKEVIRILYNFNIFSYVGACNPMEVIAQIRVKDGTLTVQGFPAVINDQGSSMALSFCYGEESPDPVFIMSAFYLAKLKPGCEIHLGSKANCRRAGCEWNTVRNLCQERKQCNLAKLSSKCLRAQAYYADAGVLCWNEEGEGNCPIAKVYMAIKSNLKSGTLSDSRGITHTPEKDYEDPYNLRLETDSGAVCDVTKIKDGKLYLADIFASPGKRALNRCITYNVPYLDENGKFELGLRLMEWYYSNGNTKRGFIIKLGTGGKMIELLYDVNIYDLVGRCKPLDIIVPFIKDNDLLTPQGFPPMPYKNGDKLDVAFCFGDSLDDKVFQVSSFYVAKLAI